MNFLEEGLPVRHRFHNHTQKKLKLCVVAYLDGGVECFFFFFCGDRVFYVSVTNVPLAIFGVRVRSISMFWVRYPFG